MQAASSDNYLWRFDWRDEFALGDDVVDSQHRGFFDEVGMLRTAILSNEPKASFLDYCDRFAANLRAHFADEEKLMDRIGFPRLAEHRVEHKVLLDRVAEVRKEVAAAPCLLDCMLSTRTLMVLLVEHLLHEDMRIKAFIRKEAQGS